MVPRRSEGTLNRGPVLQLPPVEKGRKTPYLYFLEELLKTAIVSACVFIPLVEADHFGCFEFDSFCRTRCYFELVLLYV